MRVFHTSSMPLAVGEVFFRDPKPRVSVVIKLTLVVEQVAGRLELVLSPTQAPIEPQVDLVPRKIVSELLVVGDALATQAVGAIPFELVLGSRLRLSGTTTSASPSLRAPIEGLGPRPFPLTREAPASAQEAMFSPSWLDLPGAGVQLGAVDRQTEETIGPGTPLLLTNVLLAGGRHSLRLPQVLPVVALVDANGTRVVPLTMRCDTILIDGSAQTLSLGFRGDAELAPWTQAPHVATGLFVGNAAPTLRELGAAIQTGREAQIVGFGPQEGAQRAALRALRQTTGVASSTLKASTLPFQRAPAAGSPQSAQNTLWIPEAQTGAAAREKSTSGLPFGRPNAPRRTLTPSQVLSAKEVLGWTLGDALPAAPGRIKCEAWHAERNERGVLHALDPALGFASGPMLRQECELRRAVQHASWLGVIDEGVDPARGPYYVEAMPRGGSLARVLSRAGAAVEPAQAWEWIRGLLSTLAAIHRVGLVHASVGPELVFPSPTGVALASGLLLRRARDPQAPVSLRDVYWPCAAPEVALSRWAEVDPSSDVWSVAALLLTLVHGAPLARGHTAESAALVAASSNMPPVAAIAPSLGARAALLDRCLARDRRQRPGDADVMLRELEAPAPNVSATSDGDEATNVIDLAALQARARERDAQAARDTQALPEDLDDQRQTLAHIAEDPSTANLEPEPDTVRPPPPAPGPARYDDETTALHAVPMPSPGAELPFQSQRALADEETFGSGTVFTAPGQPATALPFVSSAQAAEPVGSSTVFGSQARLGPALPFAAAGAAQGPSRVPSTDATPFAPRTASPPVAPAAPAWAPQPVFTGTVMAEEPTPRPPATLESSPTLTIDTGTVLSDATLARVLTATTDRRATFAELDLDSVSWGLSLERWLEGAEGELSSGRSLALDALLSTLHRQALSTGT